MIYYPVIHYPVRVCRAIFGEPPQVEDNQGFVFDDLHSVVKEMNRQDNKIKALQYEIKEINDELIRLRGVL